MTTLHKALIAIIVGLAITIVGIFFIPIGVAAFLIAVSGIAILGFLAVSSVAFFGLSIGVFKLGEYLARKAGKIDMTTSY